MGQIISKLINRFDGGMSNDKRVDAGNKFSVTKHFDTFTFPHKLVPYTKSSLIDAVESAGASKPYTITEFLYAPTTNGGSTYKIWGRGVTVGGGGGKVQIMSMSVGASEWDSPDGDLASSYVPVPGCFFYYEGKIYVWANGNLLMSADMGATPFATVATLGANYTKVTQPLRSKNDNKAYFFTDNNVHSLTSAGVFDDNVLVLSTNYNIVSACEYGNYIALGCVTKDSLKSIVVLWDRQATINEITENIDFGNGEIVVLSTIDNVLTAVISDSLNSTLSLDTPKVIIKQYIGGIAKTVEEIIADTQGYIPGITDSLAKVYHLTDNKIYFVARIPDKANTRFGIWCVSSGGKVALDYIEDGASTYEGILQVGNVWFVAHSNDGSTNRSDISPAIPSTTQYSEYETLLLEKTYQNKKLVRVGVMTEPLQNYGAGDSSYKISYRTSEGTPSSATSYTEIFDCSESGSTFHSSINIESTGETLPEFREIQFKVSSLKGTVITGIYYEYEILPTDL